MYSSENINENEINKNEDFISNLLTELKDINEKIKIISSIIDPIKQSLRVNQLVVPSVIINPSATIYTETTTNLSANATFIGTSRDTGSPNNFSKFIVRLYTNLTQGTLYIEESQDNSYWVFVRTMAVAAGKAELELEIIRRYVRVKFVNGATATTTLQIYSALKH